MLKVIQESFKKKNFVGYFLLFVFFHICSFYTMRKMYAISGVKNSTNYYQVSNLMKINHSVLFYIFFMILTTLIIIPLKFILHFGSIKLLKRFKKTKI